MLTPTALESTVAEYLDQGPDTAADVVLLDLNLRDGTNPAANVVRLLEAGSAVLVVSTIPDAEHVLSTDRRPNRPQLSAQESLVLRTYASGATLQATARRAGIAYGTAREYLERIKRKYTDAGRPTRTKMDLIERAREDRLELRGLNGGGSS